MSLKILIAPDSFKESLSSVEVAKYIEKGLKMANKRINTIKLPLADGGSGSCDAISYSTGAKKIKKIVTGPTRKKVTATYIALDKKTAFIEMSQAAGLHLIPKEERNPLLTTTFGVGQLIKDALNKGFRKIIIGLGGSGTNDGGVGMAIALGIKFYNKNDEEIGLGGKELIKIKKIDISNLYPKTKSAKFIGASDVKNPMLGKHGATMVYGSQKGATLQALKILEKGMKNLTRVVKKCLNKDIRNVKGSGAAGGLGGGLIAFLNAKIKPGIKIIGEITNLEKKIKNSNLIITGEGKIDAQTFYGKTIKGVIDLAKKYKKPVICICGSAQENIKLRFPLMGIFSILNSPMDLETAIKKTKELLINCSYNIGRFISSKLILSMD